MEKKRKEKTRSGQINTHANTVSSPASIFSQDRYNQNNQINGHNKKNLQQSFKDKIDNDDEIQTSNIKKTTKESNSTKQAKKQAKQKSKQKNYSQSNKNKNKTLSPTNLISRSQNIDLNERSDIEENFRSKESLDNSMTFSPIQKKEIISSPPPTPYIVNGQNDLQSKTENPPDNFNNNSELDNQSTSGNNSSFTQLVTSKCDLKAELQAAIQVNKQLKQRDAQLQKRIAELNHQSQIAHQVLEDRLSELREENVHLNELLEQLPSDERLIIEYTSLTTFPIEDEDLESLIKIGILEEGENMSVLKERLDDLLGELKYYESLYDIVAQFGEDGFLPKFFLSYFDDSYTSRKESSSLTSNESNSSPNLRLANELKHKINILVKSSDSSSKIAKKKVAKLEKEIEELRKNIQEQRFITSYKPSESLSVLLNQSGNFSLQDIQTVLISAGGDPNNLTQTGENTFSYKLPNKTKIAFDVEAVCGRPYVIPHDSNRKITLFSFFKRIIQ